MQNVAEVPALSRAGSLIGRYQQAGLVSAFALICLAFSILSPYFFQTANAFNIASANAYLGITAAITTLLLIGGGLDISVAAVMAFSSVLAAQLLNLGVPWYLAIIGCLLAGGIIGAFNGLLITYVGINALIVTIGTQFAVRGLAFVVANGQELPISDRHFKYLGQGLLFGIPFSGILMILVFLWVGALLHYTRFGKHIFAIGGTPNGSMARLSGINVERRRMQMYIMSGTLAALSGVVLAGYTSSGIAYAAAGIELTIIAAVILGGTALGGGAGTVAGTFIGVALLGVIANGMVLLSIASYYQFIFQGGALLIAVVADEVRRKRRPH